jgi:hypothetical protein
MKYVMLEKMDDMPRVRCGWDPDTHEDIAAPLMARGFVAVSAGFVRTTAEGQAETYGESTSLKLSSRPEDARFINAFNRAERKTAA